MKFICPRCNRVSIDGNLWCQDKLCPAENALEIFDNGEWFSNFEIVKLLTVLRSSAVYEARRGKTQVFLKIAHSGFQDRLKREARLLAEITKKNPHHTLPVLLPAHEQTSATQYPYGRVVYKGKDKYYEVFAFSEGETLQNILLKTPQPWYQHAGWITISLADALLLMHRFGQLHLGLNPGVVLVRFDRQGVPRPLLLDLGAAAVPDQVCGCWDLRCNAPAYTPPELICPPSQSGVNGQVGPASDVYGLGMILYEMLSGSPAYNYKLQNDEVVYQAVLSQPAPQTGRTDLKNIPQIAERAILKQYSDRQSDVLAFARELQTNLPPVPREKLGFKVNWRSVAIVVASALAISLLLAFAVAISGV